MLKKILVGGLLLVVFGILAFVAQFVDFSDWAGLMVLPVIGGVFILAGIFSRNAGFIIPGGIISGVGLGAFLIDGPLSQVEGDVEGGIFLVAFSSDISVSIATASPPLSLIS